MTKEKHFTLLATIESPNGTIMHINKPDVWFSTNPEDYGNGTYMSIDEFNYYDIRYDMDYHPGREVAYLAAWAGERWTGKDGSWLLVGLQISGKAEE